MSKITLVIFVTILSQVLTYDVELQDDVKCYDRECPKATVACKKVIETSDDKKLLKTDIYCLDAQDMVLKEYKDSKENPFGPTTTFHSTSFSGTYVSQNGNPINININNNVEPYDNNEYEDFS